MWLWKCRSVDLFYWERNRLEYLAQKTTNNPSLNENPISEVKNPQPSWELNLFRLPSVTTSVDQNVPALSTELLVIAYNYMCSETHYKWPHSWETTLWWVNRHAIPQIMFSDQTVLRVLKQKIMILWCVWKGFEWISDCFIVVSYLVNSFPETIHVTNVIHGLYLIMDPNDSFQLFRICCVAPRNWNSGIYLNSYIV